MRFKNLTLQSPLADPVAFYVDVLGLPRARANAVQIGASVLAFEPAEAGQRPLYHVAFNIPHNQLNSAKIWIEARVPLIPDAKGEVLFHSESWDADMFYFYDAGGNILECVARHTVPNACEQAFSSQNLLSISEIGVVCSDVPAAVNRLQQHIAAPLYHTQTNNSFMPLGDEHGLLIVVRQGRMWFPDTGKAAMMAPFKLLLEGGQTLTERNL